MGFFKKRAPSNPSFDELLPRVPKHHYLKHELPTVRTSMRLDAQFLSQEAASGRHEKLLDKVLKFSNSIEWSEATYEDSQTIDDSPQHNPDLQEPGENLDSQMAWMANRVKSLIDNQRNIYKELFPFLLELEKKIAIRLNTEQRRNLLFAMRVGMGLALIENQSREGIEGFYHPSIVSILANPFVLKDEIARFAPADWNGDFVDKINLLTQVSMSVGYFHSKYTAESPDSVLSELKFNN